jgi:hypothetical protein
MDLLQKVPDEHVIPIRNAVIHGGNGDDLEHSAQEQEERHTTTIGFELHRGLKNSTTTFQAVVRQPDTTNLTDGPAPIETPSMTTRSSELALSEIQATKLEESA